MEKHKKVIKLVDWDYRCSDGCCYDTGVGLYVDGVQLHGNIDVLGYHDLLELVLRHLGVDVIVERR